MVVPMVEQRVDMAAPARCGTGGRRSADPPDGGAHPGRTGQTSGHLGQPAFRPPPARATVERMDRARAQGRAAWPGGAPQHRTPTPHPLLGLQRQAGNQAVRRLLARSCPGGDCPTAQVAAALPVEPAAELTRIAGAAKGLRSPDALRKLAAEAAVHQELARAATGAAPESGSPLARRLAAPLVAPPAGAPGPTAARLATPPVAPPTLSNTGFSMASLVETARDAADDIAEEIKDSRGGLAAFCQPYVLPDELPLALADRAFLMVALPAAATAVYASSEIGAIWLQFLWGGMPARRSYRGDGTAVVDAFALSYDTEFAQNQVLMEVEHALLADPSKLRPQETEVDVTTLGIPLTRDINWGNPFEIPGHIAGGVGDDGRGNLDARTVSGKVYATLRPQLDGSKTLIMRSALVFTVRDTVDFCKGNPGGPLEQALTVPLSRLEATGPDWAADVPFDVTFHAPSVTKVGTGVGGGFPDQPGRSPHSPWERVGQVRGRDDGVRRQPQPGAPVR
jgi:hypothetical protein